MDFISNLIKRPISLVLNETSNTMDKYPISVSLPNTPNVLESKKDGKTTATENGGEQVVNSQRPASLNHSCSDDNMTDFIGVPDEFLDEFKDILPPPPLLSQNSNPLTQSLLDMEITHSLSITPPPPPLTPSLKASLTIDELLSQINDNLQLAGLNDEVLPIAAPPNKSELNPLSSKAALNNTKLLAPSASIANTQLNTTKTSTKAAGTASLTVFENYSSLHKFPTDPELETCKIFDDQQQDISGVNKSSNKFVGLTEFDEAKIPELPGDLNPNIEEQYNVTFEKCFVPTFKSNRSSADFEEERKVDKTHLLLPTEVDVTSDNETFTDCNDDRDPLASTFAETASVNVTTDADSYQSAFNNTLSSNFNNTMDNIADITLEAAAGEAPTNNRMAEVRPQFNPMDEVEPMDVDMSITMEILQNTSNNIEHVEKVLQHAENILQHLEDNKNPLKDEVNNVLQREKENIESIINGLSENQDDGKRKEHAMHETSLNKNHELPITELKTTECQNESSDNLSKAQGENIESVINGLSENQANQGDEKNKEHSELPITEIETECDNESDGNLIKTQVIESDKNPNLSTDAMNLSSNSNDSTKTAATNKSEANLNLTSNLSAGTSSQPNSKPNSPTFPMKTTPNTGFPRSPKSVVEKPLKSPFLEKSDYLPNLENQDTTINPPLNNLNGSEEEQEPKCDTTTNDINNTFLAPTNTTDDFIKRRTFGVINIAEESDENNAELRSKRQTFSTGAIGTEEDSIEKRRTFNVNANENAPSKLMKFPSMDKADSNRLTFNVNDTPSDENTSNENTLSTTKIDMNPRRTFNFPMEEIKPDSSAEQANSNKSFEAMEIDDENISQNTTIPLSEIKEQEMQQTPPSTDTSQMSQSPSISNKQQSQSPPLPTMQSKVQFSPPLTATMDNKNETSTAISPIQDMEEQISPPTALESVNCTFVAKPLSALIQKRPPIRDARARAADILSAKEQSNTKVKDEKDVLVEKATPSPTEEAALTGISATSSTSTNSSGFDQFSSPCSSVDKNGEQQIEPQPTENEFTGNNNLILNPSDFDYLLTKGNNNAPVDRSSLLLKFDPLLGIPVPVNQGQPLQLPTFTNNPCLSPTLEEDEHNESNHRSFVVATKSEASAKLLRERSQEVKQQLQLEQQVQQNKRQLTQGANKKNATMSVDVIKDMSLDNDCNKTFENSNSTQSDEKQINYKMDELEKKIKNEVLKTEDIEKKLKDAEQREEALIKRITEKDKTITKMTGVIEAYEKAIAELIADKEQLTQNYEKQLAEVKSDRDSNYHHLTSLETTFSDLHVKYEKSKEMTCQLKESEEALQAEKRKNLENLHLQEQRYDKMKNHAMQQLEIANKKLESLTREHSIEITKLKALLKKEEIARSSINEQLAHKTKENAELVKICDELISGQGSNFAFEPFDPKKH